MENDMRVVILTTDTPHHRFFWGKLTRLRQWNISTLLEEDWEYQPKYYERDMVEHELHALKYTTSRILAPSIDTVNKARHHIEQFAPEIGVVFGTGLIKPHIFNIPKHGMINVHRGIAQHYRGLDSNWWAMYNGDWDKLGITIHVVDETFDTGPVVAQQHYIVQPQDELYMERAITTVMATEMVIGVLEYLEKYGELPAVRMGKGTYYSAMPLDKKQETLRRFNEYKKELAHA
jgi:methionyl-tRNA formyltransferase